MDCSKCGIRIASAQRACAACGAPHALVERAPELSFRSLRERLMLFVGVNAAVLMTMALTLPVLPQLSETLLTPVNAGFADSVAGLLQTFAAYYLLVPLFASGGAFFSLWVSKRRAKRGLRLIAPGRFQNEEEARAYRLVERIARDAGLAKMPEVGVYYARAHMNAFATGPRCDDSLVAFSMALLDRADEEALSAVIAHEVAHIVNGDMMMLTLIQAVVNTVVLAVTLPLRAIQLVAYFDDRVGNAAYAMITLFKIVGLICTALLGALVVNWFSRQREYRADAGAARLVGTAPMIKALRVLAADDAMPPLAQRTTAAFGIRGLSNVWEWLSTHPTIEKRIARLEETAVEAPVSA